MEALSLICRRRADRLRRLPAAARRTFPVIVGLTLLSYAVNLFLFVMGRLHTHARPSVIGDSPVRPTPCPRPWC
jgi:hypothetical protein